MSVERGATFVWSIPRDEIPSTPLLYYSSEKVAVRECSKTRSCSAQNFWEMRLYSFITLCDTRNETILNTHQELRGASGPMARAAAVFSGAALVLGAAVQPHAAGRGVRDPGTACRDLLAAMDTSRRLPNADETRDAQWQALNCSTQMLAGAGMVVTPLITYDAASKVPLPQRMHEPVALHAEMSSAREQNQPDEASACRQLLRLWETGQSPPLFEDELRDARWIQLNCSERMLSSGRESVTIRTL